MSDVDLFGDLVEDIEPAVDPAAGLSAQRRLTLRQKADIDRGVHPLTKLPTRPELGTCGDCAHRVLVHWHDYTYPKCEEMHWAHSAANDCRAWWPACTSFQPEPTP